MKILVPDPPMTLNARTNTHTYIHMHMSSAVGVRAFCLFAGGSGRSALQQVRRRQSDRASVGDGAALALPPMRPVGPPVPRQTGTVRSASNT